MKKYENNFIKDKIHRRYNFLYVLIIILFSILIVDLFYIQITKNEYYKKIVKEKGQVIITGTTAPRGRIYDRNHKLIVDNMPINVIYYNKENGTTDKDELDIALKLAKIIEVPYNKITKDNLKKYYIKINNGIKEKITAFEYNKLKERKLTNNDILNLKMERITDEELNGLSDIDKEAAYIYYLMNNGYTFVDKIIKNKDVTDEEYAEVAQNLSNLKGVGVKIDWERYYPYGDIFKIILGTISTSQTGIPRELKDNYLKKGYSLNDRVGISYLEYQYEDYLRGEKNVYQIVNGEKKLIKEGTRGSDIVLTIDIELQKSIEEILASEIIKTKTEPNTEYFNKAYVVINDPITGEVLAMSGKQLINGEVNDYTTGILTSPIVVGSVVKGASHIVGYNTGALTIDEVRYDDCMKIKNLNLKCSWKYLGKLNDVTALKYSSNTFQYKTAIKVGGGIYTYNGILNLNEEAFDTYRNTFKEFGLGTLTGIDLPNESIGYVGKKKDSYLLLDFSIGQYDTYTPLQLAQYMSTIANGGSRMQLHLLKEVYKKGKNLDEVDKKIESVVMNKVTTSDIYLNRVKDGLKQVLEFGGTGSGYIDKIYKPAGKTGTSQTFYDKNNDSVVDTETLTSTFSGYAPYDNPMVNFTVVTPDIKYLNGKSEYQSSVNRRITKEVSKKFFEIYK